MSWIPTTELAPHLCLQRTELSGIYGCISAKAVSISTYLNDTEKVQRGKSKSPWKISLDANEVSFWSIVEIVTVSQKHCTWEWIDYTLI